ncbi:MAG: CRTAC1 family protein [Trueperaceae bacterium]|nr:CRTAC1 family protein [Trueperaceae bacterium]
MKLVQHKITFSLFLLGFVLLAGVKAQTLKRTETPLLASQCSGTFIAHELEHETTTQGGQIIRAFEANGGGVALGDLNNDGKQDIVLANQAGKNTILWNQGGLSFNAQEMEIGDTRAVMIFDLDGDGWQDIILSRQSSAPNFWRNQGDGSFVLEFLPNITRPLYAINWADLDQDGDLDLVGATYDAALLNASGSDFLNSGNAGVYIYWNERGRFREERLASEAQALALSLSDLNEDGKPDILVGNDFAVPDRLWLSGRGGFREAQLFAETTYSTMSFDTGDLNNDGKPELFASDMLPHATEEMRLWEPFLNSIKAEVNPGGDLQQRENVLQFQGGKQFQNRAADWGVNGTGWSWSAKFGDLDQDGFLDLYVVNGMIEESIFRYLPKHELVEENLVLRNTGSQFELKPDWKLGSTLSGRGMSMTDLDSDGDLDIVVNNLRGPSMLFENQLCEGSSLLVELNWPDSHNPAAIGAKLRLETSMGTLYRELKGASGYLSGDSHQSHFGFPEGTELFSLTVIWPDGLETKLDTLASHTLLQLSR